jgi:glycosyltransferase involved in cell wall biosynthesis
MYLILKLKKKYLMNKICHLTSMHYRFDGRIFHKECVSLSKAGHDVSLIVADGNGDELSNGIKVFDVGKENGRLQRYFKTLKKMRNRAIELNCEIYHFHDPELIFLGLSLKKIGKKVIFDMHENIPIYIAEKESIRPKFIRKIISFFYQRLEIYAVKKFDAIVSTRESINERINSLNSNIELITNFPIIAENIKNKNASKPAICFAGVIASDWRHKEIINSIEKINNIEYNLAGPAPDINFLSELQALNGWNKVNYVGRVPFQEVQLIYQKSLIGVAIYIYCNNMDGQRGNLANTKLFEFMNWGIPVICTDFSLWKQIVVDELQCGICVNPYDENEILNAIEYLIENPEIAIQMGKNGRQAVLNTYNWETQAKKLVALYDRIIETR